jgi:hypothetical protein
MALSIHTSRHDRSLSRDRDRDRGQRGGVSGVELLESQAQFLLAQTKGEDGALVSRAATKHLGCPLSVEKARALVDPCGAELFTSCKRSPSPTSRGAPLPLQGVGTLLHSLVGSLIASPQRPKPCAQLIAASRLARSSLCWQRCASKLPEGPLCQGLGFILAPRLAGRLGRCPRRGGTCSAADWPPKGLPEASK